VVRPRAGRLLARYTAFILVPAGLILRVISRSRGYDFPTLLANVLLVGVYTGLVAALVHAVLR
jgi:hypothetical protein